MGWWEVSGGWNTRWPRHCEWAPNVNLDRVSTSFENQSHLIPLYTVEHVSFIESRPRGSTGNAIPCCIRVIWELWFGCRNIEFWNLGYRYMIHYAFLRSTTELFSCSKSQLDILSSCSSFFEYSGDVLLAYLVESGRVKCHTSRKALLGLVTLYFPILTCRADCLDRPEYGFGDSPLLMMTS